MTSKKVLLVFAHPDDETFATGVTIVKYRQEHHAQITLLCATRGQAGKTGEPPVCSQEELPAVREQELRNAAAILGISPVILLDYEDKHLSDVPQEELVSHIADTIMHVQPQVVITFASHGISGHPDHKAISAATDRAVMTLPAEQNPVKKLYHCTRSSEAPLPPGRTVYSDSPETITTVITAPAYRQVVGEALRAHRTQHLSVERVFPGILQGDFQSVPHQNHYILRWTSLENCRFDEKETDLFAGLD